MSVSALASQVDHDLFPVPAHPNMTRLREVIAHIDEQPDRLNQDWWVARKAECGTTGCIAGWTVMLAGDEIDWVEDSGGGQTACSCIDAEGNPHFILDRARWLLGLTRGEAIHLFYGSVTRSEIEETCKGIAKRAGESWDTSVELSAR